jgi:glycosyltransferase involved in cell wall biosynthesis
MKILELIPNLSSGGAEKFVIDLSNQLSKDNTIYLCSLYNINPNYFLAKKISSKVKIINLGKKNGFDFRIMFKIYFLIKNIKPNIVHTHLSSILYTFPASFFYRKIKFFHTVHNDAYKEIRNYYEYKLKHFLYKKKLFYPVTISSASHKSFIELYNNIIPSMILNGCKKPCPTNTFDTVFNEMSKFKITSQTKILLSIGRLTPQKNHILLIDSVKSLIKSNIDISLVIIGDKYDG